MDSTRKRVINNSYRRERMKKLEIKDKPLKEIHVYVLLFAVVLLSGILTWIIPAGEFDKTLVEETKRTVYVSGTYHAVEANAQNPWDIMNGLFDGWVSSAVQIFVVLLMGAWVKIVEDTKLITKSFSRLTHTFQGREKIVVIVVMTVMSVIGGFGINPSIPLLPLGVVLSYSLGYDGAVAFAMIFLGNSIGYCMGAFNVLSVGIAQEIAELPRFSGTGVRLFDHGVSLLFLIFFTMRYIDRIKKNPKSSVTYGSQVTIAQDAVESSGENEKFTKGDWANIAVFVAGFTAIIYGVMKLNWSMKQYGPVFLVMAILTGIFGGLGANGTAKSFVKGCEKMVFTAMIIGIAKAISIVLANGNIIDTIVYALSYPISKIGPVLGANMMFISNSFINIFIPSASGQAATVMPLMTPIADISGITRQVAVLAFQFGDGITNNIIPTSTSLFACLGMCGLRYDKYLKWLMPVFIALNVIAFAVLTVLQLMQWGG